MKFVFDVARAGTIPSAGVSYVEGTVESGEVSAGDVAFVEGNSARSITINSVALVNTAPEHLHVLTLSIAPPSFPITELAECRLIGK